MFLQGFSNVSLVFLVFFVFPMFLKVVRPWGWALAVLAAWATVAEMPIGRCFRKKLNELIESIDVD